MKKPVPASPALLNPALVSDPAISGKTRRRTSIDVILLEFMEPPLRCSADTNPNLGALRSLEHRLAEDFTFVRTIRRCECTSAGHCLHAIYLPLDSRRRDH